MYVATVLTIILFASVSSAVQYISAPALSNVIGTHVGAVSAGKQIMVPIITWGGDIATIHGNGDSITTAPGSIFAQKGLDMKLVRMDDFKKQVETYMRGNTPFLRGTMGMINMALGVLSKDPRTVPVVIYQLTWSTGGDCLVVKDGINTIRDLKGKTIALQAYGPHVAYMTKVFRDAGLSLSDVRIKWVADLTGTKNTPGEAFKDGNVDAAFVIIPDGMTLTSKGTVGTGSEGSVRGAKILMSTKTASRIICDVYAVRSDFLKANRDKVRAFVHGLLLAEQSLRGIFVNKKANLAAYKKMIKAAAKILLDSEKATADADGLYGDCQYVRFPGNVRFFGDANWPRNFENITRELQASLVTIGLLKNTSSLTHAKWNYDQLRAGLTGTEGVQTPRFKADVIRQVIARKAAQGTLKQGELFSFEIFFKPNQNDFPVEIYVDAFKRVVDLASTYAGAVITIEGHSDPLGYLRMKKRGENNILLRRVVQASKNLSLTRAIKVRDAIIAYAKSRGLNLDISQFTIVGHGITQPKTGINPSTGEPNAPRTEAEWRSNMRVLFRIIQVEAESNAFTPLN
ncbi:MAG: ABC transporter substrate-binding protein [Planctomycetes bacterium]|nr:ABC transporter substrate-binding protein [Planctomycetota bacterium]